MSALANLDSESDSNESLEVAHIRFEKGCRELSGDELLNVSQFHGNARNTGFQKEDSEGKDFIGAEIEKWLRLWSTVKGDAEGSTLLLEDGGEDVGDVGDVEDVEDGEDGEDSESEEDGEDDSRGNEDEEDEEEEHEEEEHEEESEEEDEENEEDEHNEEDDKEEGGKSDSSDDSSSDDSTSSSDVQLSTLNERHRRSRPMSTPPGPGAPAAWIKYWETVVPSLQWTCPNGPVEYFVLRCSCCPVAGNKFVPDATDTVKVYLAWVQHDSSHGATWEDFDWRDVVTTFGSSIKDFTDEWYDAHKKKFDKYVEGKKTLGY